MGGSALEQAHVRVWDLVEKLRQDPMKEHLKMLIRLIDHRGSDVRLETGTVAVTRQDIPYPAFCWKWRCVMAYPWRQTQHINLLEFISLLNYLRHLVTSAKCHGFRMVHILDSRVVAGVVSRGRSSSKRLNRICRRFAGYALASDCYLLPLWTISRWMPADCGSRLYSHGDGETW